MKLLYSANEKYLRVLDPPDKSMLMGWRQKKGDPVVVVENNLVNRLALKLDISSVTRPHPTESKFDAWNTLMPFQQRDIVKMSTLRDCLNYNSMGLGKTIETIACLVESGATNVLIVVPKIIRYQWVDQLKRWGNLDARVYENGCKVTPGIWVVNYDKLRNEKTLLKFRAFQWQFLILDEAHKIKNSKSQQAKAVKQIPAARRIALTGTPVLRYIDDLWSILHFLNPMYSGSSYYAFVDYFCKIEHTEWGNKLVGLTDDERHIKVLQNMLALIGIHNPAQAVTQGKTHETVRLPMSKAQRELYRRERQLLLDELPEELTIPNGAVLALRLMQTTSWPGLYLGAKESGSKFEWILELCRNNPEESIVVFTVFEKTATALAVYLSEVNGIRAVTITGRNRAETNEAARIKFVYGKVKVLIGTIAAMSQGYDGLQTVSHTMVFIDRDWSPEILKQAEDRLNRMGQTQLVNIYYLECTGSFDQHVSRVNLTKAEDIRRALLDESTNGNFD